MTTPDKIPAEIDESVSSSTAELIIEAAIRILGRDGYQKLTARNVASEAGTNLALINYYFGGKQGLLLAIYDALERQRFERQASMYDDPGEPLSAKWKRAIDFYRQDLDEGFVRIHHELLIQGFSDPVLAERARMRIRTWNEMLTQVAEEQLAELGLEVPPSMLVSVFAAFWYGMEEMHLIGIDETETPFFEILQQIGTWIEDKEQESANRE
ncbi:MAG: TetR/AcrR family transcriptional regulator [Thermomicrobiales bacterium]